MERPLTSAVTPEATPPVWLQEKTQRLQALFNQREQKGGDLHPVGELMQDFEPPMQQKKFSEAEALVDRAFKLLAETTPQEQPPPPSQAGRPQSLQQKVQRLQALFDNANKRGADLQPVDELLQDFGPLVRQQKFSEAEALVDRALANLLKRTKARVRIVENHEKFCAVSQSLKRHRQRVRSGHWRKRPDAVSYLVMEDCEPCRNYIISEMSF